MEKDNVTPNDTTIETPNIEGVGSAGTDTGTMIDEAMTAGKVADEVSYDGLNFGDGRTIEEIQTTKDLFKSLGLSLDAAGKWLEGMDTAKTEAGQRAIEEHQAKQKAEWSAQQEANKAEIKKMFGENWNDAEANVVAAVNKFLPKEDADAFNKLQRETGLGNNPQFIKFLANIGKLVSEGKMEPQTAQDSGANFLNLLYNNSNK